MERIDLADFLLIAESHTGIDARQLARIDRVVQLAESALAAPFAGYGEVELHPTFAAKAAIYASRLVRYHPLPDGNKRTAYDVMVEFIERNGYAFEHPPSGLMETAEMIEKLAAELVTRTSSLRGSRRGSPICDRAPRSMNLGRSCRAVVERRWLQVDSHDRVDRPVLVVHERALMISVSPSR